MEGRLVGACPPVRPPECLSLSYISTLYFILFYFYFVFASFAYLLYAMRTPNNDSQQRLQIGTYNSQQRVQMAQTEQYNQLPTTIADRQKPQLMNTQRYALPTFSQQRVQIGIFNRRQRLQIKAKTNVINHHNYHALAKGRRIANTFTRVSGLHCYYFAYVC